MFLETSREVFFANAAAFDKNDIDVFDANCATVLDSSERAQDALRADANKLADHSSTKFSHCVTTARHAKVHVRTGFSDHAFRVDNASITAVLDRWQEIGVCRSREIRQTFSTEQATTLCTRSD